MSHKSDLRSDLPELRDIEGANDVIQANNYLLTHCPGHAVLSSWAQLSVANAYLKKRKAGGPIMFSAAGEDDDDALVAKAQKLADSLSEAIRKRDTATLRKLTSTPEDEEEKLDEELLATNAGRFEAIKLHAGRNDLERAISYLSANHSHWDKVPPRLAPLAAGVWLREGDFTRVLNK